MASGGPSFSLASTFDIIGVSEVSNGSDPKVGLLNEALTSVSASVLVLTTFPKLTEYLCILLHPSLSLSLDFPRLLYAEPLS